MVYDSPEYETYPEVEVWDESDSLLSDDGDWADLLADAEWDDTCWEGEWEYYDDLYQSGFQVSCVVGGTPTLRTARVASASRRRYTTSEAPVGIRAQQL